MIQGLGRAGFEPAKRRASRFLVRFDPVGGYLALICLEVQYAYDVVESSVERIFHTGDVFVDWGQRLRIEFDPPNDGGIK